MSILKKSDRFPETCQVRVAGHLTPKKFNVNVAFDHGKGFHSKEFGEKAMLNAPGLALARGAWIL